MHEREDPILWEAEDEAWNIGSESENACSEVKRRWEL
jgi:hypothetical protein